MHPPQSGNGKVMRKSYRGKVCERLDEIVEGDCHVLEGQEKSRLVILPRIVSTFHGSHLMEQAENRLLSALCATSWSRI